MKVLYVWHGAVEKEYRKIFSEFVKRGVNLVVITANRWFEAAKFKSFEYGIDCLVLPSRTKSWLKEQFGRVIVESMACGTPVIGSDSGEIPIVIDNPELTFKEDDYIVLANILEKFYDGVLEKDKLSDSLMEKSRKYTVEEVVKNKVEIFKKTLQQ
jgi:glycosyltransferase involved in cell wall biosynthesis